MSIVSPLKSTDQHYIGHMELSGFDSKYDKDIYKTYIKNYVKTPDVESEDFWSDFIDFFENENESCR